MVRTQIQLTEAQARALKRAAAERGISMAAVIREVLDRSLATAADDATHRRALAAIGRYSSGRSDVAEEHDTHLAEAFGS